MATRAFDFVVVGVVMIISVVIHRIGIELFQPGSPLYELAAGAENLNGAARAQLWFEILTIWMPLMAAAGIIAWAVFREYRRQARTAVQPVR
jgi:hypothetical protein